MKIHYIQGDATAPESEGNKIEPIIEKTLLKNNLEVYVYDFG